MKEIVALIIVYLFFLITSILLYKRSLRLGNKWFYILTLIYFSLCYGYFELINQLHIYIRERGYYFEFGHASLTLIIVMLLSFFTACFLVGLAFYKRRNMILS